MLGNWTPVYGIQWLNKPREMDLAMTFIAVSRNILGAPACACLGAFSYFSYSMAIRPRWAISMPPLPSLRECLRPV